MFSYSFFIFIPYQRFSCLLAIWLAIPDDNYTLKYILRAFIVLWGNTVTIVVIFGRKIYYIAIGKDKPFKGRGTSSSNMRSRDTSSRRGNDTSTAS